MKSVNQILARLESLPKADRQWIVEHLPEQAKAILINELSGEEASFDNRRIASEDHDGSGYRRNELQVGDINPNVAAKILATESSWIIVAILQSENAAWVGQVMNALPAPIRSMTSTMMHNTRRLSSPVVMSLCRSLLRLSHLQPDDIQLHNKARWRQWIRLWGRS